MWSGLPAYLFHVRDVAQWPSIPRDSAQLEAILWQTSSPLQVLAAARQSLIALLSLATAATFFPLNRLFNRPSAVLAVLFLSWSPLFLGVSSLLHPDGLLTVFSVLAILLLSVWLYAGGGLGYVVASGVALAFAALAKSPAVVVFGWGVLLMTLQAVGRDPRSRPGLARQMTGALVWAVSAAVVFVAFWPAMWVEPVRVAERIVGEALNHAVAGHALPNYFFSRVVSDPGPLFYPVAYVFRASPLALAGLVALPWGWRRRWAPLDKASARHAIGGLLLFALVYSVAMSLGAKKFDRYLLPAMAVLDVAAAVSLYAAALALVRRTGWSGRRLFGRHLRPAQWAAIGAALFAGVLAAINVVHFPYYATYFNPVAGGSRVAPRVLQAGWGEGLDQAGRWLSEQSDEPLTVASWYEKGPLSYFLRPDDRTYSFIESDHFWFDADFVVLYLNQVQRENPSRELIDHFLARPADYEVRHAGLDLARVYDMRGRQPPPFTDIRTDTATPISDSIALAAYQTETGALLPGENAQITLFLRADAPVDRDLSAEVEWVDAAGDVIWQERRRPAGLATQGWAAGEIREDGYSIPIPLAAPAGVHTLRMRLVDAGAQPPDDAGPWRSVAQLDVQLPDARPADVAWEELSVERILHAQTVAPGDSMIVQVDFGGRARPNAKLSLRLTDGSDITWAQVDKQIAPSLRFELSVPDDAPAGAYTLDAVLYDGETVQPFVDDDGNQVSTLSTVSIE